MFFMETDSLTKMLAACVAMFGMSAAALLIQCGGEKRRPVKKPVANRATPNRSHNSVSSKKKKKSKRSQRSHRARGVKPAHSSKSESSKRPGHSVKTAKSKRSGRSVKTAKPAKPVVLSSHKSSGRSKRSARNKASVETAKPLAVPQKNVEKRQSSNVPPLVTKRLESKEQPSLQMLQQTQQSELSEKMAHEKSIKKVAPLELQMEPRELRFQLEGGMLKVQLHNPSNVRRAIKVKCSDNNLYRVNPVYGYVEAGQQLNVIVVRQNGSSKLDKLVILTADASEAKTDVKQLFKKSPSPDEQMLILPLLA